MYCAPVVTLPHGVALPASLAPLRTIALSSATWTAAGGDSLLSKPGLLLSEVARAIFTHYRRLTANGSRV